MEIVGGFVSRGKGLGRTATLGDQSNGNIKYADVSSSLNSLQDALTEADQLALHRHLTYVYIAADLFTQVALRYLAEQMQTPTTLFDASHCLVLPNPASGPAVLLVGPYDKLSGVLLGMFAVCTLIDQPERLGGASFQLYVLQPMRGPKQASSNEAFANNLQLLDNRPRQLSFDNSTWLTTRWSFIRSALPQYRTTYTYTLQALLHGSGNKGLNVSSQCVFTSMRTRDELLVSFQLPTSTSHSSVFMDSCVPACGAGSYIRDGTRTHHLRTIGELMHIDRADNIPMSREPASLAVPHSAFRLAFVTTCRTLA